MYLIAIANRQLNMTDELIDDTARRLDKYSNLPDRTLILRVRGANQENYYAQEWKDGTKTVYPLGKSDNKTVIAYKRQRYLREKLKILITNKKGLKQFLKLYKDCSPEAIEEKLPTSYKGLPVNSYEDDGLQDFTTQYRYLPESITKDERFQELVEWAHQPYKRNPAKLPDDPNIARDGTPMRSKGECMWWDDILLEELPCRPDPEIEIQGISGQWHKLYPDFVFKCFDGSYIYVEHFGDWGDERYAERNKRKIQEYLDCGIVLGDNLIVTSDNADHRTNELAIIDALQIIKQRMFA